MPRPAPVCAAPVRRRYWAIHNTHSPIQAPQRFIDQYTHFGDPLKETFTAMVSVVDEAVKNVTVALKTKGQCPAATRLCARSAVQRRGAAVLVRRRRMGAERK